jgi:hypothetical protein
MTPADGAIRAMEELQADRIAELVIWQVKVGYPFQVSTDPPAPRWFLELVADEWRTSDGWDLTRDESVAIVIEEAGIE